MCVSNQITIVFLQGKIKAAISSLQACRIYIPHLKNLFQEESLGKGVIVFSTDLTGSSVRGGLNGLLPDATVMSRHHAELIQTLTVDPTSYQLISWAAPAARLVRSVKCSALKKLFT